MAEENGKWVYSHTQLDLWRTCKRRYHWRYVLGNEEPTTDAMAAGTWLVQTPVENYVGLQPFEPTDAYWETCWANFLAEFGGDSSYDSGLFTPDLPRKVLAAYKVNPVVGKVVTIEETFYHDFPGGYRYSSRPDLVVERQFVDVQHPSYQTETVTFAVKRIAWDIKLKTFNQARNGDEFFLKPALSPLDDQGISQAICAGADAFGQIQFWLGKKDGLLRGPYYLEHSLNPVLAEEWKQETISEIEDIEAFKECHSSYPWPKNPDACGKFGRVCPAWDACNFGFVGATK